MAGANISGELKNPSNDIPYGTLWAILVSTIVYCLAAIFLAAVGESNALVNDYLIMRHIAIWDGFILFGVWAATLSSALTSLV
eukprot:UN26185